MHKFIPFLIISSVFLAGCSNSVLNHIETLKIAFVDKEDAYLTRSELAERVSDALYVKIGDKPNAVLSLAFIEHGQFKWISADRAMLILEKGRLVKTTGFTNDLLYLSETNKDPLKLNMPQIQAEQQWEARSDWSVGHKSGYLHKFEIINTEVATIELLEHLFQTKLVAEKVTFSDDSSVINYYWFDLNSGYLLKSVQTIAPFWPQVEMVHISTAGRLLGIKNKGNRA